MNIRFNPLTQLYAVLVEDEAYAVDLTHQDALALRASLRSEWTVLKHEED